MCASPSILSDKGRIIVSVALKLLLCLECLKLEWGKKTGVGYTKSASRHYKASSVKS